METAHECQETFTDVVELCALLQCLGFSVKSLDTSSDENTNQEEGQGQQVRNVVLHCQTSGLHIVMEKTGTECSCPVNSQHNSGIWQVSAVSQGKVMEKEIGSSILGSLPKNYKEKLSKGLHELMRSIKSHNESIHTDKVDLNKSTCRTDITPENTKNYLTSRLASPARYRSLDTLTMTNTRATEDALPPPGLLMKKTVAESVEGIAESCEDIKEFQRGSMRRQSTYSLNTPKADKTKSNHHRNKTSSPIQTATTMYDNLLEAKRKAEDLNEYLGMLLKSSEEGTNTSMSSLVLNVSDISLLKAPEKPQFMSSPNLSGYIHPKTHVKLFENAQGLLDSKSSISSSTSKMAKLRRLSPSNLFKPKKDSKLAVPLQRCQSYGSGKISGLIQPRIVTPVRRPTSLNTPEPSPRLNSSKNKYSHVKSTIPKPSPSFRKKE